MYTSYVEITQNLRLPDKISLLFYRQVEQLDEQTMVEIFHVVKFILGAHKLYDKFHLEVKGLRGQFEKLVKLLDLQVVNFVWCDEVQRIRFIEYERYYFYVEIRLQIVFHAADLLFHEDFSVFKSWIGVHDFQRQYFKFIIRAQQVKFVPGRIVCKEVIHWGDCFQELAENVWLKAY